MGIVLQFQQIYSTIKILQSYINKDYKLTFDYFIYVS